MKFSKRLIFFLLFSVLGISFVFYGYQVVYTPNILVDRPDKVILIPDDATFKSVQQQLVEGGYVNDLLSFSFLARLMDYDKGVKPGLYTLRRNMSNRAAILMLRAGKQEPVKITFNGVRTVSELAEKITRNIDMTPDEFKAAVMAFADNNAYGFNHDNVISMFIPNTYEVYYNITGEALMERMYFEYDNFWNDGRKDKATKVGLTPIEITTLASIVQAETMKREEAPIIAGLYINRLKKGIALQADPTLKFAVGDFSLKRVLNVHKEIDSPYNTYKYAGLPPGPINMPEIFYVDAVLDYKLSDYYYMCAREDFSGYHYFTNSYREHLRNAARYQEALTREQRIARQLKRNKK